MPIDPDLPVDNTPQLETLEQRMTDMDYRMNTHDHTSVTLTKPVEITEPPVTLVDAATIKVDATLGKLFSVTLKGNRTLGNPTGGVDGKSYIFEIIQDGTGSRTLAYASKFAFGVTLPSITLTTTASKRDYIGVIYRLTTDKYYVVAVSQGF